MAAGKSIGERLDRELMELLQELRVVLPRVQVLLAFLLLAPFQPRFGQLPGSLRNAFFASVACATLATVLLIAPSAHHRLRWRARDKSACCGLVTSWPCGHGVLAAAIVLALQAVTNVLYVSQLALLAAGVAVVVFGWIWYGLPTIGRSPAADHAAKATEPPGADPGEPSADSRGTSSRLVELEASSLVVADLAQQTSSKPASLRHVGLVMRRGRTRVEKQQHADIPLPPAR